MKTNAVTARTCHRCGSGGKPRRACWRHLLPVALLLGSACAPAAAAATDGSGRLQIDSTRSHAEFSVRLLWLRQINGRFDHIYGTLAWSPASPPAAAATAAANPGPYGIVDAWIDVASVRMPEARYERWLLAPEFFDAAHYPRVHFVSAPVPLTLLASGGALQGRLTMRGVTRPVVFDTLPSACPQPQSAPCTIKVAGTVRRSDFGMRGHRTALSDRVQLGLLIVLSPDPTRNR
jgi:polyisoprenoid-binding protein YceI